MNNNLSLHKIKCLIPDLPPPEALHPYLHQIHNNRWYSNFGHLSKKYEQQLINLIKTTHSTSKLFGCLSSSGTSALELALSSLNLAPGSTVLVPSLTFPASATAIIKSGLKPLISDVDLHSWQLTPEIAYRLAEQHAIAAVMPVATFGVSVNASAWDTFSETTNIPVIIDAAGAFPFQKVGNSSIVCFSFHATKPFGIGEGGAVFVKNHTLITGVRRLSNFGFNLGEVGQAGTNAKLSEYHAAVGLAQLNRQQEILSKRSEVNQIYHQLLSQHTEITQQYHTHTGLCVRNEPPSLKVIKLPLPSALIAEQLAKQGIETRRWYYPALHNHAAFKNMAEIEIRNNGLRVTEHLSASLLGLPFHTFLTQQDISRVVTNLIQCLTKLKELEEINDNR